MNKILKEVLEIDKKAQERTKEVEDYRTAAIAALSVRKSSIIAEESEKARESALRHSQKSKAEGEQHLAQVKESNQKILDKMDSLYEKNSEKWINDIVSEVIATI